MRKISHVKREIIAHYEKFNRQRMLPRIPQKWIEGYLDHLYFSKRSGQVSDAWDDLCGLSQFLNNTTYTHLNQVPWWEYSRALEWLGANASREDIFEVSEENATRMFERWGDFFDYVQKTFNELDSEALLHANEQVLGGKTLKLIKKIPYTGDEFWLSLPDIESNTPIEFSISDFWILVMFSHLNGGWDALEEGLRTATSIREKRKRIQSLHEKLERTGHAKKIPSILRNRIDEETLHEAERWFYKKRIPTHKAEATV